jgi:acyl-CoA thioesterase YciA
MSGKDAVHPWGEPSLRLTLMPRDTNAWGTIFGGVILSYIDLAGGVEAHKLAPHTFVTVAMREVVFHEPVFVGDLVSFYTRTVRIGRTSVTVQVMVEVLRRGESGRRVKVTEAEAVYVAVDEERNPTPIRPDAVREKRAGRPQAKKAGRQKARG